MNLNKELIDINALCEETIKLAYHGYRAKEKTQGIPSQNLAKIFQPSFTTKPTGEGTGLGLSMAYDSITTGHGGELKVRSRKGEGADFEILLHFDAHHFINQPEFLKNPKSINKN